MKNIKLVCLAASCLLIGMNVSAQKLPMDVEYPLAKPVRTILTGLLPKGQESEAFGIYDYASFRAPNDFSGMEVTVRGGEVFKCEFELVNPVYLVPQTSGVGMALPPAYLFEGGLNVRWVSGGILIAPGDSIFVEMSSGIDEEYVNSRIGSGITVKPGLFDGIPFFNLMKFSGRGVEKLWCMQEIIRNTTQLKSPQNGGGTFAETLANSDAAFLMVNKTIDKYKAKVPPVLQTLIRAHYLPMLSFDISEILTGAAGSFQEGELDINSPYIKQLYAERKATMDQAVNPDDPNLLYSFFYNSVVRRRALLEYCMKNGMVYSVITDELGKQGYDILVASLKEGPFKTRVLGNIVAQGLQFGGLGSGGWMAEDFVKRYGKEGNWPKGVYALHSDIKQRLSKGGPTYAFELPDPSGRLRTMQEFTGKVVIMDFMYNGCPGCAKMVPSMAKMHESFADNDDVVFIAVSIDKDKEDWLDGIGKFSDKNAIQLNTGGRYHPLITHYDVVAYPQIVAIGKDGKLITNNAPRPHVEGVAALTRLIEDALRGD